MDLLRSAMQALYAAAGGGGGATRAAVDDVEMRVTQEESTVAFLNHFQSYVESFTQRTLEYKTDLYVNMCCIDTDNGVRFWRMLQSHPVSMILESTANSTGERSPAIVKSKNLTVLGTTRCTVREVFYTADDVDVCVDSVAAMYGDRGVQLKVAKP